MRDWKKTQKQEWAGNRGLEGWGWRVSEQRSRRETREGKTDCQWGRWRIRCQMGPEGERVNGAGLGVGGGGWGLLSGVRGVFRGRLEDERK